MAAEIQKCTIGGEVILNKFNLTCGDLNPRKFDLKAAVRYKTNNDIF